MDSYIYLDTNATTPYDPAVIESISNSLVNEWGNPSSSHHYGAAARHAIEEARTQVAEMIDSVPSEIVFMSGGTEANCTLLQTFSRGANAPDSQIPHIISSNIEHDSIRKPLEYMLRQNMISLTLVPVDQKTHCVKSEDVIDAITPSTILVSIMLANNETGVIQPVKEIGEKLRNFCTKHEREIYFHTDAAQAVGKIPVNVKDLNVDYLTIVGHKFYGPRIGALFVKGLCGKDDSVPYAPLFLGGGQEYGLRAGTENTAMIVGLGKACNLVTLNLHVYCKQMLEMRNYLEESLRKKFTGKVVINAKSDLSERLPNTCNISFDGQNYIGCHVLAKCKRIIASVGSACHSKQAKQGSSVLRASGISVANARNAIRLSVGRYTTKSEIDLALEDLQQALTDLSFSEVK